MEENTEVELDGKKYVWDGDSWTDPRTYMEPPANVVIRLNERYRRHEADDKPARAPRAPRAPRRSSPPARFVPRSLAAAPPPPPPKPVERVTAFAGDNAFLSNDAPATVHLDGQPFPSVTLAFNAAKELHDRLRVGMQREWDEQKRVPIMRRLLRSKFAHAQLRAALLATADKYLADETDNADPFWNAPTGHGENQLGRLLMDLRAQLNKSYHLLRDEEIVEQLREYLPDNPVIPDTALTRPPAWQKLTELYDLYKDELSPELMPALQARRAQLLAQTPPA